MADPYAFPVAEAKKGSPITLLTVIGVLFLLFMVYQVGATIERAQETLERTGLSTGERVEYDFVARLPDGTLWATSKRDVAEAANRTEGFPLEPAFSYTPRTATLNPATPGLGYGPEVERTVLNARTGQTLRLTVPAGHGTGDWAPFTQDGLPRELITQDQFQRTTFFQEAAAAAEEGNPGSPLFNFTQLEQDLARAGVVLADGAVFKSARTFPPTWEIVFDDVNADNRSVLFHHTVQDGAYYDVPGLPGGVTVLLRDNETQLVYRLDLEQGGVFVVRQGTDLAEAGFSVGSYRVDEVTDDTLFLLYNSLTEPEKVGLPLHLEITLIQKVN